MNMGVMIAALLVAGTFWFGRDTTRADTTRALFTTRETRNWEQSPRINIKPQQGAPLQIISTWVESAKPQNFRVVAQVQNQSVKGIRAYAMILQTVTSKQQNGHSQFANITQRSAIWQPTEIRAVEFGDSREDRIISVRLTVDFVEFADGTAWGPDSENSREMLAGQREGARLERQKLRQLMEAGGQEAVAFDLQMSDESKAETGIRDSHSAQWIEGFRNGAASVRRRLGKAIASGNKEGIKAELSRPFDTSEEDRR